MKVDTKTVEIIWMVLSRYFGHVVECRYGILVTWLCRYGILVTWLGEGMVFWSRGWV